MTSQPIHRAIEGLRPLKTGLTLLFALGLVSCGKDSAKNGSADDSSLIVAVVAGKPITQADIKAEIMWRSRQRRPIPDKAILLDEMIEREALLHRARKEGLESEVATRRSLENLLIAALRQRELEGKLREAEITEAELQAAYEKRIQEFTRPAKIRVSMLRLKAGKSASDAKRAEVRARLEEAREKIMADPAPGGRGPSMQGFGALAINYSEDQASRYRGGDIGWLDADSTNYPWPEEVLKTAKALEKGKLSEIIEIDGEFFLVMKTDSREAAVQSFAEAKPALKVNLLRSKREQIEISFREETNQLAETSIDTVALGALEMPASTPSGLSTPPPNNKPPALPVSANN